MTDVRACVTGAAAAGGQAHLAEAARRDRGGDEGAHAHQRVGRPLGPAVGVGHAQIMPALVAVATAWARVRQPSLVSTSWTTFLTVRSL